MLSNSQRELLRRPLEFLKKNARRYFPRLYFSLDRAPRISENSNQLEELIFSGWAFHSSKHVTLELEVGGKVIDRFYPIQKRHDVLSYYRELPNSYFSGFVVRYSKETREQIFENGGQLYADAEGIRKQLWSYHRKSEKALRSDQKFEALKRKRARELVVIFGYQPSSDDSLITQLASLPLNELTISSLTIASPAGSNEEFLRELVSTDDCLVEYKPGSRWEEFLEEYSLNEKSILFFERPVDLRISSLKKLIQTHFSGSRLLPLCLSSQRSLESLAHTFQEEGMRSLPQSRGVTTLSNVWTMSAEDVRVFSGKKKIQEPLLGRRRSFQATKGLALEILSESYSLSAQGTSFSAHDRPELVVSLPYRAFEREEIQEELEQLAKELSERKGLNSYFVCHDDQFHQASLEGVPIYPLSEVAQVDVDTTPFLLATDDWSERAIHLLGYTRKSTKKYRLKGWNSEIAGYPELLAYGDFSSYRPLERVTLGSIETVPVRDYGYDSDGDGLSFIVPIYNSLDSVVLCVRSLLRFKDPQDEIILVNDLSDGGTSRALKRLAREFPALKLIERSENGGFIEACYTGVDQAAVGNDIVLVNSDVVLSSETIPQLKKALTEKISASLFSVLSTGSRKLQVNLAPGETLETLAEKLADSHSPSYPTVITPEGQFLCIRSEALTALGFFDRVYNRGFSEESDLAMRYFLAGEDMCVVDNAVVYHEQSASFGSAERENHLRKNRPIFEGRFGLEYELASKRFQEDGAISKIQQEFSYQGRETKEQPLISTEFVDKIASLPVVPPSQKINADWLEDADVIFFLPDISPGGGSLSVLQHVQEMLLRGVRARVAYFGKNGLGSFPLLTEPLHLSPEEALKLEWRSGQSVVCTHWSTAYPVKRIVEENQGVKGYYYIQDYEPWFYPEGQRDRELAEKTYSFPFVQVAKTDFLRQTVDEHHSTEVVKISPGIDRGVFYPGEDEAIVGSPRFVAMYRPSTVRRGPDRLIEYVTELLERCPEAHVTFFGERGGVPKELLDRITVHGKLSRKEVARIYRESHFIVDLSRFHGFGRPGLEGMACGLIPILSPSGGIKEYALPNENCILGKGSDTHTLVTKTLEVIHSRRRFVELRKNAVTTADKYSEYRATTDWLEILGYPIDEDEILAGISRVFHQEALSEQKLDLLAAR